MPNTPDNIPLAGKQAPAALAHEIAELIVSALNLEITADEIDPQAPLYREGLGLDSIDILEIAMVISKRYGFKLGGDEQDNVRIFSSLNALASHVVENRTK